MASIRDDEMQGPTGIPSAARRTIASQPLVSSVEVSHELLKALHQGEVCKNLEDYLVAFDITLSVLQTEEALYRVAYELAQDAAEENVRYLEVRYSPALHQQKNLKMTTVIDAVLEGLRVAKRETGIKCGVIVCGIRHINPQMSIRLAELSVAYKNRGVTGFDLAGRS